MQYSFNSSYRWNKERSTDQSVEMDLDLQVTDLFESEDVEAELAVREESVRRDIFETVVQSIVPKMARDSGASFSLPEGQTNTTSHTHARNSYSVQNDTGDIRNSMKISLDVEANKSLNGMQALYAERASVANIIANNVVHSLKATFYGVTTSTNNDRWKLEGDSVKEYGTAPMPA